MSDAGPVVDLDDPSSGSPIGIFIAHPLPTVLAGLVLAIDAAPDLKVLRDVTTTDDVLDGLQRAARPMPRVVLISLALKGRSDCFWLIRRIRESFPAVAVIVMGENSEKSVISRSLFVGADGFLDKKAELPEFLDGIRRVARGEIVIVGPPSDWLGPITEEVLGGSEPQPILTERECEVLRLAAQGQTARQIGSELGLRERTITTHLGRIYARLGVHGRVAAISQGARLGLIEAQEVDLT